MSAPPPSGRLKGSPRIINKDIANKLKKAGAVPATGSVVEKSSRRGIGNMAVGKNFKVS
ncbi:hypothetical protein [uncultured Dysgonomonas sp.]|uniref:hypothetical protein n=1 Tax=uncultured Dysgonomonas sp. TaxID=206096 RepID=UPI0025DE397A|nr:hypothetical protein [uncultured Dysgonomonas sp.]